MQHQHNNTVSFTAAEWEAYAKEKGWTIHEKCKHPALVPIQIGGFDVYLGASPDIRDGAVSKADLIMPLNGYLPTAAFGRLLPIVQCELPDRGGVPADWPSFIARTVKLIRSGYGILAYCTGGHGRTGTFGASLISVMERETEDPIAAIRERHCTHAVESLKQATAIYHLRGQSVPAHYIDEFVPVQLTISELPGSTSNPINKENT